MKFVLDDGSWVAFRSSAEPRIRFYYETLSEKDAQAIKQALYKLTGLEKPASSDIEKEKPPVPVKFNIAAGKAVDIAKKAEAGKASPEIYETYIREDAEALGSTLVAITVDEQRRKKPAIIVYDTGIDPESISVVQAGEAKVKEYLGGTLGEVRGTGKALLEKIRVEAQAMAARLQCNVSDIAIVSIVGDESRLAIEQQLAAEAEKLRKEGKAGTTLKDELGKIINVASNKDSKYVPVIALYDIALRWAYELDLQQITERLNRIANNPLGPDFTTDDLLRGVVRIMPRIGPANFTEAQAAYKAAQQALQSM
jgi:hypothetical protein